MGWDMFGSGWSSALDNKLQIQLGHMVIDFLITLEVEVTKCRNSDLMVGGYICTGSCFGHWNLLGRGFHGPLLKEPEFFESNGDIIC